VGAELKTRVSFGRTRADGKALLETDELIFRGSDVRLSIPFKAISDLDVRDGKLRVTSPGGTVVFELGDAAARWAEKIRNPPKRIDKLGIKPGQRVVLLGVRDAALKAEIEGAGAKTSARLSGAADVIFIAANNPEDLTRLETIQASLQPAGAVWVVRPKGKAAISESDVRKAARDSGLVDVKVVRFSDTHTAEKFVIPVARRG